MLNNILSATSDFLSDDQKIGRAIKKYSEISSLNPQVVSALIMQESLGHPGAYRYEPAFFARYLEKFSPSEIPGYFPRPLPSIISEKKARATSWGLMQIMGQTAREFNFQGKWLPYELCQIDTNIDLGCRILAHYIRQRKTIEAGLLRYNGGGDPDYPIKVLDRIGTKDFNETIKKWGLK
jgi:hypothetical protein